MIIFRVRARRYEVTAEDFSMKLKTIIEKRRPADDNGKAISKCAHRDSSADDTAIISLLSDCLRTTTEKFYNLEDEVVRQAEQAKIEETRKAQ